MTVLFSVKHDGEYRREFIELLDRPKVGDCISALGTVAKVTGVILQSGPPLDPEFCGMVHPRLEYDAEILAEPVNVESEVVR